MCVIVEAILEARMEALGIWILYIMELSCLIYNIIIYSDRLYSLVYSLV